MRMRRRVLVTGVGSGIGQGILVALKKHKLKYKIYVSDASIYSAGLYLSRNSLLTGKLENSLELEKFLKMVIDYKIEIIFPGNEFDLISLSHQKARIKQQTGALVISSKFETIEIANDKWKTYNFCLNNDIPAPKTFLITNTQDIKEAAMTLNFPFVIKPRFGTASRGIAYVNNLQEAETAINSVKQPLAQEFLKPESSDLTSEYTCSVFKDKNGLLHGPFIAERNLKGGSTWIAKVADKHSLHEFLLKIANALDFSGPLNIQLIETLDGPKLLELNCRFSGTTGIRSYFGFNEPEMAIKSFLQGKLLKKTKLQEGTVVRYIADVVIRKGNFKKHL